jgi:choline dehydrogenase-like flavoprotein
VAASASSTNHADVLIIGGASGAVVAQRLAEPGLYVMFLEAGEWPDRATFPGTEQDWELSGLKQWSADPNVRQAPGRLPDRRHRLRHVDHELQRRRQRHYYLGRRVHALIGYPGQQARPVMPEGFPAYIAEGLLDHLVGR